MKTRMIGSCGLALVLTGLPFAAGSLQAAEADTAVEPVAVAPTTPPAVWLSAGAGEVAKLAQAGLGEPVMLSFVANSRSRFSLGSDQIVYLNDLGVSSEVVKAMIERDAALDATTPPPPPVVTNIPPPVETVDTATPPVDPGATTVADDADYFYNSLQPYGNWIYVGGAGLCWQPTVCIGNRDWRPYSDRGRWVDTDCGWYWQSDYSWGWAAFHYGRWFCDANRGWVWTPDRVWGPAWVSWRQSSDYCGWAPLSPAARFLPGVGLAFGGRAVGVNFEFGLQASHYTFIPTARLCDYAPARYSVATWQAGEVFNQTAVVNHFATVNRHAINRSIDPREVAALSRTEVRHAEVRELKHDANNTVTTDHFSRHGGGTFIYRPQLPAPSINHVAAPRGNFIQPRISVEPTHNNAPLYLSGSSPVAQSEKYPSGSLVVIGSRNSSVAAQRASTAGQTYHVFDSAHPAVAHDPVYASPARYETAQSETPAESEHHRHNPNGAPVVIGEHSHTASDHFTHEARTESHVQYSTPHEARTESRVDARVGSRGQANFEQHSESHAAVASSSSGNSSHAPAAPAATTVSTTSSFSGSRR